MEKLLVMSNFSISHSVFYWFGKISAIFIMFKIVVCKHFEFGRVQNLLFGKGLKTCFINPLPNDKILDSSKLKDFAVDNLKLKKMAESYSNQ